MTDAALIAKKLAQIDTCLSDLRRLATPALLDSDIRERRLGEPQTNRDLFDLLANAGWLDPSQAAPLKNMASFRNILVHGYDDVDLDIVRSVLEVHLDDLAGFATSIRARL